MSRTMCVAVAFMLASAVAQAQQKCSSGGEEPIDKPQNVLSLLQSKLQMNVLEIRGEAMLHPACATRKLIINSHVDYGKALDRLVASLKEYDFPLKDCVVFRGGALAQAGPRIGPDGMTFVDLTFNSFDLNAVAGLSRYKNHSLVCADMYFLIHDSTQIGPCFPQAFSEIKVAPTEIITSGMTNFANQCIFGRSVVDNFGADFEAPVDKKSGYLIEEGQCVGKACSIDRYALKRTVITEGLYLGAADVYNTGKRRTVRWHQAWDLYKFISHPFHVKGNGDFESYDMAHKVPALTPKQPPIFGRLSQARWEAASGLDSSGLDKLQRRPAAVSEADAAHQQDYAPSCPRKCVVKKQCGIVEKKYKNPMCESSADA